MRSFRVVRAAAVCAVALASTQALQAQIRQPGRPVADRAGLSPRAVTETLPRPDIEWLMAEDEERQHRPLRYGALIPVAMDANTHGEWDSTPAGDLVWRLRIVSPGAFTLGVTFDRFQLPEGGRVFLYDDARTEILGAYTSANHQPNGMLGVQPVTGDAMTIEYVQPASVAGLPELRVGEIIHDYRDLNDPNLWSNVSGTGAPGAACLIDINCPEGANYQDVKQAVIRTLVGGGLCSASILNNTANDGTPYFLTANHCGNMTNGVFLFNYENTTCGGGGASNSDTMSGATLLAATGTNDSQLYLLNNAIPTSYDPFWAGWSRTLSTGGPAVSIGHGGGQPKQIAIDNNGPLLGGNFWSISWRDGIIIGGNSGGPIFRGAGKYVIGPACCVSNFNCGQQTASYGRFDRFWNNSNLAQWLDPIGSGAQFVDGYDPDVGLPGPYCTAGTTSNFCQAMVSVTGTPSASAGSGFTIDVSDIEGDKQGLIFYGLTGRLATPWGSSQSFLCVKGPRQRTPVTNSGGTAGACDGAFSIDFNAFIQQPGKLGVPFSGGETVYTQAWFRDPPSIETTNMSNAYQFDVNP